MIVSNIFIDRDNDIRFQLYESNALIDLNLISKFEIKSDKFEINSEDTPEAFEIADNELIFKPGVVEDLPKGRQYVHLIVYSEDHPKGIVWDSNDWQVNVVDV